VLLGCGSIGGIGSPAVTRGKGLTPEEGLAQIDAAVAMGINTLDTANSYGGGVSEQVVGQWLASHPHAEVLVATKVGNLVRPDQQRIDLSAAHIAAQVAASVDRLGRIDLYLSHAPDPDLLRIVRERGLGYTPFSPLAGGVLAGRYRRGAAPPPDSRMAIIPAHLPDITEPMWDALDALTDAARRRDVSVPALALAWVLNAPDVTAPLVAPRRAEQFADIEQALQIELDEDERAELVALFR
jgi:aryl-alcohol dehydrogenase-like predicted oxidoreductase